MIVVLRIVVLATLLAAGAAHATQQDDLERLRKRISALQQNFDKTSESKSEVADELRESERAISDSNRKLHNLAQQQQTANLQLGQLQQRAAGMEKELQGQQAMLECGGEVLITADHGNAEQMLDRSTNQAHTAHTLNLVPFLYIGRKARIAEAGTGALQDVAPTLLAMMGLPQPPEMTGKSLIHIL